MNDTVPHESLLAEARRLLEQSNLKARKSLAQHFLISRNVLQKIVSAASLSGDDIVIEVGPGLGVLTRELVQVAGWVIAVELDNRIAELLKNKFVPAENLTVINQDILQIEPGELFRRTKSQLPSALKLKTVYKVVANLPYYITSAVIRRFLEASVKPSVMIIMVQKEIAREIVAGPGEMSLLSVSVQFYGKPKIVSYVPAACFYPPPKVDSAILRIDIFDTLPMPLEDIEGFFRLVRAGFSANRKQIINSLSGGLKIPKHLILPFLSDAGIEATRRAETLSIKEWQKLFYTCKEQLHVENSGTGED